jgi:single-strand DNA-binding protein
VSDINKVILTGRVGKDAEMKTTSNDAQLCKFSIAVSGWGGKNKGETTTWVNCDLWGTRAKVGQYIRKGMKLMVVGQLVINEYEGKWYTSINVDDVVLPDRSGDSTNAKAAEVPGSRARRNDEDDMPF